MCPVALPAVVWDAYLRADPRLRTSDPLWPERAVLQLVTSSPSFGGRFNWKIRGAWRWSTSAWERFLKEWWTQLTKPLGELWEGAEITVLVEVLDFLRGRIWMFVENRLGRPDREFFKYGKTWEMYGDIARHRALAAATAFPLYFQPVQVKLLPASREQETLALVNAGVIDNIGLLALLALFEKGADGKSLVREGSHWLFADAGMRMSLPDCVPRIYFGPRVRKLSLTDRGYRLAGYTEVEIGNVGIGVLRYGEEPWQRTPRLPDENAVSAMRTGLCPMPVEDAVCIMAHGAQSASRLLRMGVNEREGVKSKLESLVGSVGVW